MGADFDVGRGGGSGVNRGRGGGGELDRGRAWVAAAAGELGVCRVCVGNVVAVVRGRVGRGRVRGRRSRSGGDKAMVGVNPGDTILRDAFVGAAVVRQRGALLGGPAAVPIAVPCQMEHDSDSECDDSYPPLVDSSDGEGSGDEPGHDDFASDAGVIPPPRTADAPSTSGPRADGHRASSHGRRASGHGPGRGTYVHGGATPNREDAAADAMFRELTGRGAAAAPSSRDETRGWRRPRIADLLAEAVSALGSRARAPATGFGGFSEAEA